MSNDEMSDGKKRDHLSIQLCKNKCDRINLVAGWSLSKAWRGGVDTKKVLNGIFFRKWKAFKDEGYHRG